MRFLCYPIQCKQKTNNCPLERKIEIPSVSDKMISRPSLNRIPQNASII